MDPDRISWIVSNDAWLFNRDYLQPELAARSLPRLLRTFAQASDASDFFRRAEAGKWGMRLDESIWPTRFRCATVSPEELQEIRRIKDVIRMGRVQRIEPTELVLDKGRVPTHADVLHIDCTACGLTRRPPVPVFAGDRITLQPLVMCQQLMSSALTAVIELKQDDEETKNAECVPVPHPELPKDYFSAVFVSTQNLEKWAIPYGWWLLRSRLTILHHVSWLGVLRLVFGLLRWEKAAVQAIERFHRELDE